MSTNINKYCIFRLPKWNALVPSYVQAYSNTNYTLLGMIVEAVYKTKAVHSADDRGEGEDDDRGGGDGNGSGGAGDGGEMTAAAAIRQRILEPLSMTSAYLESHEAPPPAIVPTTVGSSGGGGSRRSEDGGGEDGGKKPTAVGICPHHHYATSDFASTAGISPVFAPTPSSKYVLQAGGGGICY